MDEEILKELYDEGKVKAYISEDGTEIVPTEKGVEHTRQEMIKDEKFAVQAFIVLYNSIEDEIPDRIERIEGIANFYRDMYQINLLRLLKKHDDEIVGMTVKDIPEELLKMYD